MTMTEVRGFNPAIPQFVPQRETTGNFAAITGDVTKPDPAAEIVAAYAEYTRPWDPRALQESTTSIFNSMARRYGNSSIVQPTQPPLPKKWAALSPELGDRLIKGLQALGSTATETVDAQPEPPIRQWTSPVSAGELEGVLGALRGLDTGPAPSSPPETSVTTLLDGIAAVRRAETTGNRDGDSSQPLQVAEETVIGNTAEMKRALGAIDRINEDLASEGNESPWWMRPEYLQTEAGADPASSESTQPAVSPSDSGPRIPDFLESYALTDQPAILPGPQLRAIEAPSVKSLGIFSVRDAEPTTLHLMQTTGDVPGGSDLGDTALPPIGPDVAAHANTQPVKAAERGLARRLAPKAAAVGAVALGIMAFRRRLHKR